MFCFYVEVGEEWGWVEDINYGSTVWAAPVPLPCSRRLYLPLSLIHIWQQWEEPLRRREPETLAAARAKYVADIDFWQAVQYLFYTQWHLSLIHI